MLTPERLEKLLTEATYTATRSGGKGGQHVNKTSTKVSLSFNVIKSEVLNSEEKEILFQKLKSIISDTGALRVSSSGSRSQAANKVDAQEKFMKVIKKALTKPKVRKKTKLSVTAIEERLKEKKKQSEKKKLRGRNENV